MVTTIERAYIVKAAKKVVKMMRKACKDWTPDGVQTFLVSSRALEKYPAAIYPDLEAQIIHELCRTKEQP